MSDHPEEPTLTSSADLVRVLFFVGPALETDLVNFLGERGEDAKDIRTANRRLPLQLVRDCWNRAMAATGDGLLGLRIGAALPIGALGLLDELARTSNTLATAFERVVRFGSLLANAGEMTFEKGPNFARFTHCAEHAHPGISQLITSLIVKRAQAFSGKTVQPVSVSLMQEPLGRKETYAEIFGAKTHFGHHVDELLFSAADVNISFATSEAGTEASLLARAEEAIGSIPPSGSYLSAVSRKIGRAITQGDPRIEVVAKQLALTPRTLQRRLLPLGVSYRSLVEDERLRLAQAYLSVGEQTREEVAAKLGYASATSLHRALRRWGDTKATGS